MRQVADEADVSVQTVSNLINGRLDHMAPTTEARVRAVIDRLGYRPNSAAQGLRSQSNRTISFVVVDPSQRFLGDAMTDLFLAGLGDEVREREYSLLIQSVRPSDGHGELTRSIAEGRAEGAVIFLSGPPADRARVVEGLSNSELPVVLLQEHGVPEGEVPSIVAKDREGSRELCQHLIARGHQRIAFLIADQGWSAIEQRVAGYQDAHAEAGIRLHPTVLIRHGDFRPLNAAAVASRLLDLPSPPTAVMCGNDLLALGVLKAAREAGLKVPGDLAVTGFDDFEFSSAMDPGLSTVRVPGYEMGRYAAQSLIRALHSGSRPQGAEFDIEVCLRASG
ncbi:MAG: LacI family DNA-binding transcriptional regulator [Actinomycetota bacterium]|nr:LacI family DNA-binding transcriptional regulator [Actinomycetota bacterium]